MNICVRKKAFIDSLFWGVRFILHVGFIERIDRYMMSCHLHWKSSKTIDREKKKEEDQFSK